ncbi:hypothetical protein Tsubulata_015891 [Turnera subulata]|uniref:Uncharacterized protein n=1 Tax=Turnera subulata TaxID=218843 RepID=A0A9Q0JD25_9ROSI|nr:hypothetical protein Tsubulata_015891 [Turnera subulata]
MMEPKNLSSDLHAFKQLYGLLQHGGTEICFLGERARVLLKTMLDDAVAKLLECCSKIMASTPFGASNTSCSSSQSMLPEAVPDQKPLLESSSMVKASGGAIQVWDINSSLRKLNPWRNEKQSISTRKLEYEVSELSKPSISSRKTASRKHHCRVCQKSIKKTHNSVKNSADGVYREESHAAAYWIDEHAREAVKQEQDKIIHVTGDQKKRKQYKNFEIGSFHSVTSSVGEPSSLLGTDFGKVRSQYVIEEKVSYFSKEVDDAIKSIECGISSLEPVHGVVDPTKLNCPVSEHSLCKMDNSVSPMVTQNKVEAENLFTMDEVHPAKTPNVKAMVNRIESMSRETNQNNRHIRNQTNQHDQGLRFPPTQLARKPPAKAAKSTNLTRVHDSIDQLKGEKKSKPSVLAQSVGSRTSAHRHPRPMVRPTLLDFEDYRKKGIKNGLHQDPEFESEASDSARSGFYSYSTTSRQEASSSSNDIRSINSSRSSGSISQSIDRSSRSRSIGGSRNRSIGGSSCSGSRNIVHSSSSRSIGSSDTISSNSTGASESLYEDANPPNRGTGPRKRHRSRTSGKKAIGRFRKFKNKLGLIFHHHHHHHHHHHVQNDDEEEEDDDEGDGRHKRSMWKRLNNIFHHQKKQNKHYERQADERMRKSVISNKNHAGHFHALVHGLVNHVKHSKKPKPSRRGIGRVGNAKHGHNRDHWWKMIKQGRGVKLPKKGRVKLGYKNGKAQLRAPRKS